MGNPTGTVRNSVRPDDKAVGWECWEINWKDNDQIMKGIVSHPQKVIFYTKNKWGLLKAFNQKSDRVCIKSQKGMAWDFLRD